MNPEKKQATDQGYVSIKVGSATVKLYDDDRIAKSVLSGKPFEPVTLQAFADHVKPYTRVLDIGCYSGLFSIVAQKFNALPIGFEPYKPNYKQIERNQRLNDAFFLLVGQAVSDKEGEATLGYRSEVHLTSGASLERKSGDKLKVHTTTVDKFMSGFWHDDIGLSVIKMDVERHEPAVIRGARLTIDRFRPVLIVEANDLKARAEVVKAMEGLGYPEPLEADVRNLIFIPN